MSPPTIGQKRLAGAGAAFLIAALGITVVFADTALSGSVNFLPLYAGIVLVNDLITSVMLLAIFWVQHSRAVLALSMAYLVTGLTIIPWLLTFPGVFSAPGLLGAGLQSTAAIAALRLYAFPLLVIVYLGLKDRKLAAPVSPASTRAAAGWCTALVVGLTVGSVWLIVSFEDRLPLLMANQVRPSGLWDVVLSGGLVLIAATFVAVWSRLRSALDLWLLVVLLAMFIERLLLGVLSPGRLSLGWWAGRIYGLGAASVVLAALLYEMTSLYARLVQAVSGERRAREARLMAMQALSASIAHEVNQPLTSMVTNAEAGLRWLRRSTPDLEEVGHALQRIASDGRRAGDVINNVKAVFRKGTTEQIPMALVELVSTTLAELQPELRAHRVQVRSAFDPHLPTITGNPVQLQQVIANLVRNAAEAMSPRGGSHELHVRTYRQGSGFVVASFEDDGPGLDPRHASLAFEAVFTTKPKGIGMGLVISRSIVEAHGGRIWAGKGRRGAIIQFSLPVRP